MSARRGATAWVLGVAVAGVVGGGSEVFGAFPTFLTPNVISGAQAPTSIGGWTFVNKGLQGVGRVPTTQLDVFGETFGSVSALQMGNWARTGAGYSGTFFTLPDRGQNEPPLNRFSDYDARIQTVNFTFAPYTGAAIVGQTQIVPTYVTGQKFTYANPLAGGAQTGTSGLDPGTNVQTLFGQTMPLVPSQSIGGVAVAVNKLAMDAEGLVLRADGSGWVSDEYGPNVYYFNANKEIVGAVELPEAIRPRTAGALNFNSLGAPASGRRNNQGMEGIALSPDGTKLFAMVQSATLQESGGANAARRNVTRLLTYDVSGTNVPTLANLVSQSVVQLPTFDFEGDGTGLDRTAAQSEILALSNDKILVLSRDGNGLGSGRRAPVYKSVIVVDTTTGTNFASDTAFNAPTGSVAAGGLLNAGIDPLDYVEAVNVLNRTDLEKFGLTVNNSAGTFGANTISEKLEGLSLVSALDPENPNDYFLFVANDNDFSAINGRMEQADGSFFEYTFADEGVVNDTVFLAYRVTIVVPEPAGMGLTAAVVGMGLVRRRR